jgi:uncharacterized protein YeaO (DUF488 family)
MLNAKRVYDPVLPGDGKRVLVERLWPRGLSKEKARADVWLKEIAPSNELRQWYAHDAEKWEEFRRRYREELKQNEAAVTELRKLIKAGPVTLVYAYHDQERNAAVLVREFMEGKEKT